MVNNVKRIGNFTSSEIYKLMSSGRGNEMFGKGALTYIREKKIERKLGRSFNDAGSAKPLIWGKFMESMAFDLLSLEYNLTSQDTIIHPEYNFWSGSPDGTTKDKVFDIKCPFTVKSFASFAECKDIDDVRNVTDSGENYYWQLVSNAILTGKSKAELIYYCPFKRELSVIREAINNYIGDIPLNKLAWINFADDDELPYIPDDSVYNNLYRIQFEIPEDDIVNLTRRVEAAGELLLKD